MGIGITDVTPENAKFFHLDNASGALVTQVDPNTPGSKAGLKVGDVITKMDGRTVTDAGQLQVEVGQQEPGTTVHLDVIRDGKNITVPVTVAELGKNNRESESASNSQGKPRWGIGLGDLNGDIRDQLQAPSDVHGAVVERVQPGSPADNAGLAQGDVIEQVNHQNVKSAQEAQEALSKVPQGQDALVLVWSNGGSTFRVLHSGSSS
jgi:serine protease Do